MIKKSPPTSLAETLSWLTLAQAKTWKRKNQSTVYTIELVGIEPTAKYCGRWVRTVENKFRQLLIDDDCFFDDK